MTRSTLERARAVATVLVTLLVVLVEFLLLTSVYHSDDGIERQHEAQVRVAAVLEAERPDVDALRAAIRQLAGTRSEDTGVLISRARSWIAAPGPGSTPASSGPTSAPHSSTRHFWCWHRPAGSSGSDGWYDATASSSAA